jgi:hypothetical protein
MGFQPMIVFLFLRTTGGMPVLHRSPIMLKRILFVFLMVAFLGLPLACDKDEIKVHEETEVETTTQEEVVVP